MTPIYAGAQVIKDRFFQLGIQHLFTDIGRTQSCLTRAELLSAAQSPLEHVERVSREHLEACPRCARTFAAFRSSHLATVLPDEWDVALRVDESEVGPCFENGPLFLRISLETRQVEHSADEADWVRSPLHMRVSLLVDAATDVVSLNVHDVPTLIRAVGFSTPTKDHSIVSENDTNDFEFLQSLTDLCALDDSEKAAARIWDWLRQGQLRLVFTANPASPQRVHSLIVQAEALEREYDYELPSGLHTDTHINIGKLCRTESTLHRVAAAFDALLRESTFDTIVTNGWAMATVARRILLRRNRGLNEISGQIIICEGYLRPSPVGDLLTDSRVLILTDVAITGGLIERLRGIVELAGASVVDIATLVRADTSTQLSSDVRALCVVPMKVFDPRVQSGTVNLKERRVFNPVSGAMTRRAPSARSPSEFLEYDDQARQFWEFVDRTGAYQHHHREGNTHYIAFVDTKRLMAHSVIANELACRLRDKVLAQGKPPDIMLVPGRARSRVFAEKLLHAFHKEANNTTNIRLVITERGSRRNTKGSPQEWHVPLQCRRFFRGARVLIVDAAAGHGTTIDQLWQVASALESSTVSAAVLLSRLTEGCEDAFNARLNGGFHSLFRLPIRPIVIRGRNSNLCPVCRRNAALREVGEDSGVESVRLWAEHITHRRRHPASTELKAQNRETQLALFKTGDEFLRGCRESVASGVTLHALNAAMTNGMAPLSLPELLNDRIPSQNRAAMVRNLPLSALEWSGDILTQDLIKFLESRTSANVWRASAEALARHGSTAWLEHVSGFVERVRVEKTRIAAGFWSHIACSAYLTAAASPTERRMVRDRFEKLLNDSQGTPYVEGLQRVLDTIGV